MRRRRWKKVVIGAGTTLVLATVMLLATGWDEAVASKVTSVFVTNDAANPVPVEQQGTATVHVDNASFKTLANAPSELYSGHASWQLINDNADFDSFLTVPAGKTLVLEQVSGHIRAVRRMPTVEIRVSRADPPFGMSHYVRFTQQGENTVGSFPTETVLTASDELHMYAPPGSNVGVVVFVPFTATGGGEVDASGELSLSGYFLPAP